MSEPAQGVGPAAAVGPGSSCIVVGARYRGRVPVWLWLLGAALVVGGLVVLGLVGDHGFRRLLSFVPFALGLGLPYQASQYTAVEPGRIVQHGVRGWREVDLGSLRSVRWVPHRSGARLLLRDLDGGVASLEGSEMRDRRVLEVLRPAVHAAEQRGVSLSWLTRRATRGVL